MDGDVISAHRDGSGQWTYYRYDGAGRRVQTIVKVGDTSPEADDNDIVTTYTYGNSDDAINVTGE